MLFFNILEITLANLKCARGLHKHAPRNTEAVVRLCRTANTGPMVKDISTANVMEADPNINPSPS